MQPEQRDLTQVEEHAGLEGRIPNIPGIEETTSSVSFLGVELQKGTGGNHVPDLERVKKHVITEYDLKLMQKIAVGLDLSQPVLLEGGSGLGKSDTVRRMCAYLDTNCFYANCAEYEPEILIGAPTAIDGGFGWRDGIVLQAIREGGVLFLDEYNFMRSDTRGRLHEVIDAVINGATHVTIPENNGERVEVHPNFRLIAAQNPPGGDYEGREVLDKAQLSRFFYIKEEDDLPGEVKKARLLGQFGFDNEYTLDPQDVVVSAEPKTIEDIKAEEPHLQILLEKYLDVHAAVERELANDGFKACTDAHQPVSLSFQREKDRVFSFALKYYSGSFKDSLQRACRFYYTNKFLDEADRRKVGELIAAIDVPVENTRRVSVAPSFGTIEEIMGANFVGPEDYETIFGVSVDNAPPLPAEVTPELLNSECPLSKDGRLVKDTHVLVLVPKELDGSPLTLNSIRERAEKVCTDRSMDRAFYEQDWYDDESFANTATKESHWALIPTVELPDSTNKTDSAQLEELKKYPEYETVPVIDQVLSIELPYLKNHGNADYQRPFENMYGRCEERDSDGYRVYVGGFGSSGLLVDDYSVDDCHGDLGRFVRRKLKN